MYEFWDRLGDLIYLYFQTKLKPDDVYFSRIIRDLSITHGSLPEFVALKTFYEGRVLAVLDRRHSIVHKFLLKSKAKWDHIDHRDDRPLLEEDQREKMAYRDDLIDQALNCIKGYRLTMALIKALPEKATATS